MTKEEAGGRRAGETSPGLLMARIFTFALPALVIAGGVVSVIVMGMLKPPPEQNDEPPAAPVVLTETASLSDIHLRVLSQGEVRPRTEITVAPQVGGRLVSVSDEFVEGGFFEAGDVLIQVEDADYRLAVVRAEAEVAQARRALESEIASSDIAKRDWNELGEGDPSLLTLREPQLAEARAALRAAEAGLETARLDLERTTIVAPFDGRVASIAANVGQFVTPGQSLGAIFSTDLVEINLTLSDTDLARAGLPVAFRESEDTPGPAVRLTAIVGGVEREWVGRITRTGSRFDSRTRLLAAITQVDDPYGAGAATDGTPLAVGLFVGADVTGRTIENGVVLPRSALRGDSQVFVVRDDNSLEVRDVVVADSNRERLVLSDGVEQGERVIVSPLSAPADGMEVAPVEDDEMDEAERELAVVTP